VLIADSSGVDVVLTERGRVVVVVLGVSDDETTKPRPSTDREDDVSGAAVGVVGDGVQVAGRDRLNDAWERAQRRQYLESQLERRCDDQKRLRLSHTHSVTHFELERTASCASTSNTTNCLTRGRFQQTTAIWNSFLAHSVHPIHLTLSDGTLKHTLSKLLLILVSGILC